MLGWVAGAIALTVLVPYRPDTTGSNFGDLLPADSQVFKVEQRILEEFRVPLLSGTTVVVHEPGGMNLLTRADSLLWALATTQDTLQAGSPPKPDTIAAAIPVPTGRSDVTVTYLYVAPGTGLHDEVQLADRYAAHFKNQPDVSSYVTGFVPAQIAQLGYLDARLRLFEFASVLVIVAVVALAFRSLLAPVVVVGVASVGYLVYFPLLSSLAAAFGFTVPASWSPYSLPCCWAWSPTIACCFSQRSGMNYAADSTGRRLPAPRCGSMRPSSPWPASLLRAAPSPYWPHRSMSSGASARRWPSPCSSG